jgi:hypothetical protein
MTLDFLPFVRSEPLAGYAGVLEAARHPALADRFHFWRGASGSRYACTRFQLPRLPAYENAILLFVRRRGGEPAVLGVHSGTKNVSLPYGTDEIHIHLVQGGDGEMRAAFEDLSALAIRRAPLYLVERQAA